MHSEYLRKLFLHNELSEGRYEADGAPAALRDIRAPVFAVSTETDHVAPWVSVYKLHLFLETEITFVITSGGHNAGIVSEPGHPNRSFRMRASSPHDLYLDPDAWTRSTPSQQGSWWPAWTKWLSQHSGAMVTPPSMGNPAAGIGL